MGNNDGNISKSCFYLLLALLLSPLELQALPLTAEQLLAHYHHLHRNPELSLREEKTSAYLLRRIEEISQGVARTAGPGRQSPGT